MTEQFETLIKKGEQGAMYALFRNMSDADKKQLVPTIKKLIKGYSEPGPLGGGGYGYSKNGDTQRSLLQFAAFICFNRTDYEKTPFKSWELEREELNKVIDWYCPSWFSDYVNKQASEGFMSRFLTYPWIMELTDRGFLQPGKELIVRALPGAIFRQRADRSWEYDPELILMYPITLQEHIWWLFELESDVRSSGRWLNFGQVAPREDEYWMELFKALVSEDRLPRSRMLQESLLASNRNFNKLLSGWFAQLFTELEPTKEELLLLQKELFGVLGAPTSKTVNTGLQAIKKILTEKEFESDLLIDMMPVLLSSDTKSVVSSSLVIMEKLALKQTQHREKITLMACQCFISTDEEIQSRAAKLIEKFGDPTNAALRQEIKVFEQSMRSSVRKLLSTLIDVDAPQDGSEIDTPIEAGTPISPEMLTVIPFPAHVDDLVFLACQAFDNNEPWHIDVLAAGLLQFAPHLKQQDIPLFEPAFQRAFQTIKGHTQSSQSSLDRLLAIFFIDFGNWLIKQFPSAATGIKELYKRYDKEDEHNRTSYLTVPLAGSYTAKWTPHNKLEFYEPYRHLLLAVLEEIRQGDELPLLSTPTHMPCWISPGILIDRLHRYQQAGKDPAGMDLQVALSRCFLPNAKEEWERSAGKLTGEFHHLMNFLLNESAVPEQPFDQKAAWMVASLTKKDKQPWTAFEGFDHHKQTFNNYTGELVWQTVLVAYTLDRWDPKTNKRVDVSAFNKVLSVERAYDGSVESGFKKLFSFLRSAPKDNPMLYKFLHYRSDYPQWEHNDIKRILSLIPNNPEPLLADTINRCLRYSDFFQESDKKMAIAVAQFLYEIWLEPGKMATLFLGTSMLSSDKTVANTAGEIWLKAVSMGKIDNVELGKVIGLHERIEYGPLKRLTDLFSQQLLKISPLHDRQLLTLIEHILPQLPDEPIKNLKKLLEIYIELLAMNKGAGKPADVSAKFKTWERNAGLKKIL